jgi:hypothetical protein
MALVHNVHFRSEFPNPGSRTTRPHLTHAIASPPIDPSRCGDSGFIFTAIAFQLQLGRSDFATVSGIVTILHVTTMEDSSELIADEQFLR